MIDSRGVLTQNTILVLDSDQEQCDDMCALLARENYSANPIAGIAELVRLLSEGIPLAVIIDIDNVDIDNVGIRDLTVKYPGLIIFCISKHQFHPELQDAICYHTYACLNRPVQPEELFYFIRSLEDQSDKPAGSGKFE